MTIYSGKTRISEEEDLWRIIGIHEVTSATEDDRQIISGHMENDDFYQVLGFEPDIYYDLTDEKYKYHNIYDDPNTSGYIEYPECTHINGYFLSEHFYQNEIIGQDNVIYYDADQDKYFIYKNESYQIIRQYTDETPTNELIEKVYYHNGDMYQKKEDVGPNYISILINNQYEKHPYVQGLLANRIFYSDEATLDSEHIYFTYDDEKYYSFENDALIEKQYDLVSVDENTNQATCYTNLQLGEFETKILVKGYKVGNRFFETVAAGYIDPIIPSGNTSDSMYTQYVYFDQLTNAFYFLEQDGFRHMGIFEQYEEHETHDQNATVVNRVLYYHNYENETTLHSRIIIDGYFVNNNFYRTKVNGDSTVIYHTIGTDSFWKYNNETNQFNSYNIPDSYDIGVFYSNKIQPSFDYFYIEIETDDVYYYDGSYRITQILNAYNIPQINEMCEDKITNFVENNQNLYYASNTSKYYVYKEGEINNLVVVNPVSCYIINNIPCKKERPAMGAIYYDIESEESYIYDGDSFVLYDYEPIISNEDHVVLSLTKADLLIDDNILDQNPYDNDVILGGADSNHAGLMTADLYNRFVDLENRYKMRVSSTTYETLADLEEDAPTDTNCIYIVGTNKQYVLSDDGTYVQIGETDLSNIDLQDVASVNDVTALVDDVSDILEKIAKQNLNLQNQIDLKYPTANIITDMEELSDISHQGDAVGCKALMDYMAELMSGAVSVDHLITETVVERVEKVEDSIQVYYKDIVTAVPLEYIDSFVPNDYDASGNLKIISTDKNYALSARLLKNVINDLQGQINNVTDNGLSLAWSSPNDPSDATIVLSISNRVI